MHKNAFAYFNLVEILKFPNHISITSAHLCNLAKFRNFVDCWKCKINKLQFRIRVSEMRGSQHRSSPICVVRSSCVGIANFLMLIESAYYSYLIKSRDILSLCKSNSIFLAALSPTWPRLACFIHIQNDVWHKLLTIQLRSI